VTQTFNPSVMVAPVVYPRPVTGFRRLVQASHPLAGFVNLLSTSAEFTDTGSPNFTKYAFTPGVGPKQKTLHTSGTKEISWTLGGEITSASLGMLNLLTGSARGVNFSQLLISQGVDSFFFNDPTGTALPWNQFSLSGNQNAGLTFTLEGKATIEPATFGMIGSVVVSPQIPTWATGNDYVLSWSLSHNVQLQP
jgi:hypothetical protein